MELPHRVIIDAREFVPGKITGIARVLRGIAEMMASRLPNKRIILGTCHPEAVPIKLNKQPNVFTVRLGRFYPVAEAQLALLAAGRGNLFLSPYPKLPLWPSRAKAVNIVHDVFYLTHDTGCGAAHVAAGRLRLAHALRRADLTWYDSRASLSETRDLMGFCGRRPVVRYPGVAERFAAGSRPGDAHVLRRYGLSPGYVLVTGNGRPHKNLGVLLRISNTMTRPLVIVGVGETQRKSWMEENPGASARWIGMVDDNDLPALMRGAFCLAQPSLAEGYAYPPLEAMACGTPAVVSDIAVLRETTGERVLFADPFDANSWRIAVAKLEDIKLRSRLIYDGIAWASALKGNGIWEMYFEDLCRAKLLPQQPGLHAGVQETEKIGASCPRYRHRRNGRAW